MGRTIRASTIHAVRTAIDGPIQAVKEDPRLEGGRAGHGRTGRIEAFDLQPEFTARAQAVAKLEKSVAALRPNAKYWVEGRAVVFDVTRAKKEAPLTVIAVPASVLASVEQIIFTGNAQGTSQFVIQVTGRGAMELKDKRVQGNFVTGSQILWDFGAASALSLSDFYSFFAVGEEKDPGLLGSIFAPRIQVSASSMALSGSFDRST